MRILTKHIDAAARKALLFGLLWAIGALGGCGTFQQPGMTVDQLAAVAADKNVGFLCIAIQTPAGTGKLVAINADRMPKDAGTITADSSCTVSMTGGDPDQMPATLPVLRK